MAFLLQPHFLKPQPIATSIFQAAIVVTASKGKIACLKLLFQPKLQYSSPYTTFAVIENAIIGGIEGNHANCMNYIYAMYAKKIPTRVHMKAITTASSLGRTTCLRNLLEMTTFANIYLNETTSLTKSLIEAALNGNDQCVDLLRFKLDLHLYDKQELYVGQLIDNVMIENSAGLRRLFELGASPNLSSPDTFDYWNLGQFFLPESGINLPQNQRHGEKKAELIPLLLAAKHNINSSVRVLLECGANPDVINSNGESLLTMASTTGNTEVVRLLLKHGAHPDVHQVRENGPLQLAARRNNPECLKALLQQNAKTDLVDRFDDWLLPHIVDIFHIAGCFVCYCQDTETGICIMIRITYFSISVGQI